MAPFWGRVATHRRKIPEICLKPGKDFTMLTVEVKKKKEPPEGTGRCIWGNPYSAKYAEFQYDGTQGRK